MIKKIFSLFGLITGLFVLWVVVAMLLEPEAGTKPILPGPLAVMGELQILFGERHFHEDILHSLMRISLGVFVAMVPACIVGTWFGLQPKAMEVGKPLFSFAKTLPPVALIPILIIWLGIGLTQQIALLFVGIFFNLTMMVAETVSAIPKTYKNAASTLGVSNTSTLIRYVVVPYGLPDLINHIRIMVGVAWTYLIVVEMVAARTGIGRVIIDSQKFFLTARVIAGVFVVGVLGVLIDFGLQVISHKLCPWRHDDNYWTAFKNLFLNGGKASSSSEG